MQIDVDCFKDDKKELLKSKLMLITQQRFRSERQCFHRKNQQDWFNFK